MWTTSDSDWRKWPESVQVPEMNWEMLVAQQKSKQEPLEPLWDFESQIPSWQVVLEQNPDMRFTKNGAIPINQEDELRFRDELKYDYERRMLEDKLYLEKSRNLSIYDAIAPPRRTLLCGGCPARPLIITQRNRPLLIDLSKIALDHFSREGPSGGASFEFDDLVKCTFYSDFIFRVQGVLRDISVYCITFKAKGKEDHDAITIFQAKVSIDQLHKDKLPVLEECRVKI